eukprot:5764453-Prymnesium_polylepis.1
MELLCPNQKRPKRLGFLGKWRQRMNGSFYMRMHSSTIMSCRSRCSVRGDEAVRVAVCFFGLARSLTYTEPSLRANLLGPVRQLAAADVFVHALLGRAENSHFAEEGLGDERGIEQCEHNFLALAPCRFAAQDQSVVDSEEQLVRKASGTLNRSTTLFRLYYDLPTLLNVYRSRFSLSRVAKLVLSHEQTNGFAYTHAVAARPDTAILSPFRWRPLPSGITVSNAEHGGLGLAVVTRADGTSQKLHLGGVNDRFAYGDARTMLRVYMGQYDEQLSPLDGISTMTTSETLLCDHLVSHGVKVALTPLCIVRVRATGELATYAARTDMLYPPRGRP